MSPAAILLLYGRDLGPAAYLLLARAAAPSGTPAPVEPAPATPIADGGAGAPVGTRTGRWKSGKSNIEEVEK